METKFMFFSKINKNNNPQSDLPNKNIKQNKTEDTNYQYQNSNGNIITDSTNIKGITKNYKHSNANKFNNLDAIGKFLKAKIIKVHSRIKGI